MAASVRRGAGTLASLAVVLAACGGGEPAAGPGSPAVPIGGRVTVAAQGIAFAPNRIATVPTDLVVEFDNRDAGVPHDLVLYGGTEAKLAATEIITGPASTTLVLPALVPGTYRFSCTVHPNMVASLTVTAPG